MISSRFQRGPVSLRTVRRLSRPVSALTVILLAGPGVARGNTLADLSIEELMNESVTSVARKETRLFASPAAVTVISADDVRRLGLQAYPEALRWLPGTNVARINATQWAVSVRGFNSQLSDKLLVLQDGRTLYTPTFGGVFWDSQGTVMEDLERIEVVRGPGATLWGANAVNGVINIVTKNAKDTQGTLVSLQAGTEDRPMVVLRHGGMAGDSGHYRVFLHSFRRDDWDNAPGVSVDRWEGHRAGFRYDGTPGRDQTLTVQGEYYRQEHGESYVTTSFERPFSRFVSDINKGDGHHLLARWSRHYAGASELSVQGFYDAFVHGNNGTEEERRTADLELQHRIRFGERHDLVWGAGYRESRDRLTSTPFMQWSPGSRTLSLVSAFVQDEVTLVLDRLRAIVGTKFEHSTYTHWETQPAARLLWTPSRRQTVWASVARAVRAPTRLDTEGRVNAVIYDAPPPVPPTVVSFFANPQARPERVTAFELGWRFEPAPTWSLDLALFHHEYDRLATYEDQAPSFVPGPPFPHVLVPTVTKHTGTGSSRGVEVSAVWQPVRRWRLAADYSFLEMRVRPDPEEEGDSPKHRINLRSYLDLPGHWEINAAIGYTSSLYTSLSRRRIPAFTRLDLGAVWRPRPAWEFGVWGRNLLDPHHPEFGQITMPDVLVEIPREFTARAVWRF